MNAKPLVNNEPSLFQMNQDVRVKKAQMIDEGKVFKRVIIVSVVEKNTEIERENRILVEKMSKILRKKGGKGNSSRNRDNKSPGAAKKSLNIT